MGSFLHAFRPASSRSRKNSEVSLDVAPHLLTPDSQYASPEPRSAEDSPVFSFDPGSTPRPDFSGKLKHSASVDHLPSASDRPLHSQRSKSHLQILDRPRSRQTSLQSGPPGQAQPALPLRADSLQHLDTPPPVPPKDPLPTIAPVSSLWKSFNFLPFLRDNGSQIIDRPSTPDTPPSSPPRRGDVICLTYNTLDDRQMRRLEGKSDHRPVIGGYALYI